MKGLVELNRMVVQYFQGQTLILRHSIQLEQVLLSTFTWHGQNRQQNFEIVDKMNKMTIVPPLPLRPLPPTLSTPLSSTVSLRSAITPLPSVQSSIISTLRRLPARQLSKTPLIAVIGPTEGNLSADYGKGALLKFMA